MMPVWPPADHIQNISKPSPRNDATASYESYLYLDSKGNIQPKPSAQDLQAAVCRLEKTGADCPDETAKRDAICYTRKYGNKATIRADISKNSATTFLWNFETGKGKVVNQRGTMNTPITATLAK